MTTKPTYKELQQRVKELEKEVARDINRQKSAEYALQESEAQKKAILDASVDRIRLSDTDMRIIWANQTHAKELNIHPEDLIGKHCYTVFVNRDTPCLECPSINALTSGKTEHVVLTRPLPGSRDEKTYLDSYAIPVKNESGNIESLIQITRNVTEQVLAEKALQESEKELRIKTMGLEEVNTALRVLLKQRDEDKTELEEKVLANVKELVVPFLEKVKKIPLNPKQAVYIDILESNLNDVISPFLRNLSAKYITLTPKEIKVAYLIKEGKTTKEIGEIMTVSPRTIETHRKNIRKKLAIEKKKGNLRSHLLTFQ
jgi:DNA-binding CsgD family transcriptional regulator